MPTRQLPLPSGLLRASLVVLLSASSLSLLAAEPAKSTDWPCWHGPDRNLISTETGWEASFPESGPRELWRFNVGIGFSSVSVANGRVYTMGNKKEDGKDTDTVWCLDASTGKEVWKYSYPCRLGKHMGPRMTPTVDGERVFTMSREGQAFCFAAKTGKVLWSEDFVAKYGIRQTRYNWGFACSPLVLGDALIYDLGKVLALNKKTGKLIWSSGDVESGFSSPTTIEIGGETYLNCFNAYGLALVHAKTGKELDRYEWKTSYKINSASPIPSGDKIFISSGYGTGCALLKASKDGLSLVYQNKNMRNHVNTCVLKDGYLYGFDGQQGSPGRLSCLDFDTGEVQWTKQRLKVGGSLMLADGKLICMIDGGELLIAEANPVEYREISRAKVLDGKCWTYPVLSGGRIYCRSNEQGELVCLDVRAK